MDWNQFRTANKGKGWSQAQFSEEYRKYKATLSGNVSSYSPPSSSSSSRPSSSRPSSSYNDGSEYSSGTYYPASDDDDYSSTTGLPRNISLFDKDDNNIYNHDGYNNHNNSYSNLMNWNQFRTANKGKGWSQEQFSEEYEKYKAAGASGNVSPAERRRRAMQAAENRASQAKQPPAKPSSAPRHSSSTTTTTSNKKKQQDLKPRQTTSTSTWACLVCTFENSLSSSNCEMCNTARPYANGNGVSEYKKATTTPKKKTTKQQHIVSTPSPSSTSIWTCNACTFENDNSAEECTMCTSPRPFSSSSQFPSPSSVMQQAAEEEEDYDDEAYDGDTNLDVVDTPIHNKAKRTECVNWGVELYDLEELLSDISPTDQKERQKILARIQKAEKKYEEISGEKVGLLRNHMRNIQNKNIKVTNITGKKLDIRKNKELTGDASHRLGVQVAMSLVVGTNHSGKPLSEKTILKLAEKITTYDNFVRADHHHNMEYYHYGEKHICNYLMGVIDKKELCDIIHNMKYSDQGTVLKATNTILNFMFPNLKKNKDDIGILDNVLSKKRIIKMKTILQDIQMIAQETKRKIEKPNRFSHSDYY